MASIKKGLLERMTAFTEDPDDKLYDLILGIVANISGTSIGMRNLLFEWKGFENILNNSEHLFTENATIQQSLS